MSRWRYLKILDTISSTAVLGLRIDAAVTVSDGKLGPLPLPAGFSSLRTLRHEQDVAGALRTFLQEDLALAKALLLKVQAVLAALERSVPGYGRTHPSWAPCGVVLMLTSRGPHQSWAPCYVVLMLTSRGPHQSWAPCGVVLVLTSRGPTSPLMLTSLGPHVTLMLTGRGPLVVLAWQAFFARHVFLRSALLLTYDDAAREDKLDLRLELKMINFAFSYEVTPSPNAPPARVSIVDTPQEGADTTRLSTPPSPSKHPPSVEADAAADTAASAVGTAADDEGGGGGADGEVSELSEITICHTGLWDGAARSHTDGYLLGVRSLESVMRCPCQYRTWCGMGAAALSLFFAMTG